MGNTGSTQTNIDVLITLDTATLIGAGKMQSDCDDIRVIDSDDTTTLTHWVEYGCNTSVTQLWARIPSLSAGGETIYVYYGNSGAAGAQESWTGKFLVFADATCPTGWTANTDISNGRFPYGASSYNTTGGSTSHTHSQINVTSTGASASQGLIGGTGFYAPTSTHTHATLKADITTNSSVRPPYLDMIVCDATNPYAKQNVIVIFDNSVPSGWARFSALDSQLPRKNSSYGGSGGSTTHNHSFTGTYVTSTYSGSTAGTWGPYGDPTVAVANSSHTHTSNGGTTGDGNNMPPYLTVVYGKKSTADAVVTVDAILMASAVPPRGWTRFSALDSKYPYGSTSYGTSSGTSTHDHSITVTTGGPSANSTGTISTDWYAGSSTHTHSKATTTDTYSNLVSYATVYFVQKNDNSLLGVSTSVGSEETPAPAIPTIGTPVPQSTSTMRWYFTDNASDETGFKVYDSGNTLKATCATPNLTYCDEGSLSSNTSYQRKVTAYNATSESDYSSLSVAKYTHMPTPSISGTAASTSAIDLTATGLTNLTSGTSGAYFDCTGASCDTGINAWIQVATDQSTGLSTNTQYTYQVKGRNGDSVETSYSSTTSKYTKTEAPTLGFGTPTNSTIPLTAGNTFNLTSGTSGVYFDCTSSSCDTGINAWVQVANDTATSLSVNTQYTFQVKARNGDSVETSYSSTSSKYTLANAPLVPTVSFRSGTSANVVLNSDQNGNPSYTQYLIYESGSGQYVNYLTGQLQAGTSWATYSDWGSTGGIAVKGLSQATTYTFQVKAKNGDGVETAYSSSASIILQDPSAGCYLILDIDPLSLTFYWADRSTGETGFKVQRKVDAGSFADLTTKAANSTSHTDDTISYSHVYTYRVAPTSSAGDGQWCTSTPASIYQGAMKFEKIKFGY